MRHIRPHEHIIGPEDRILIKGHKPLAVWLSGLSGSGKSTIASLLEKRLHEKGFHTFLLDGDNTRSGLNSDLGFSDEDRKENLRRLSELSKLFTDAGIIVISAFISPFESDRKLARSKIGHSTFFEVFVDCPLEVCESRDPKGLYKKARLGEIPNFTGITSAFEPPSSPDAHVRSDLLSVEESVAKLVEAILPRVEL